MNDPAEQNEEKKQNEEEKRNEKVQTQNNEQVSGENDGIISLKVKADPPDISPDERKKNVKKLAGAISHSLRDKGEVNVRCFGNASIGKAAKALAIARKYIEVQQLQLACAPSFITAKIDNSELTGISFVTFASNKEEDVDIEKCNALMVKADIRDVAAEDRSKNVKKLAGAITHSLEDHKEVVVRCFGNATIGKAAKALAIARGYTATRGSDLYCWPQFIVASMGPEQQERTGIAWYAYTNEA